MYLLKKAAKNLLKNKGRNIVIFIMLSMVALASVISLTIFNVTQKINTETENYYAGEVSIKPSAEGMDVKSPTIEDIKKYVSSDYLRSYVFYKCVPINVSGLKLFDEEYNTQHEGNVMETNARAYGMLDDKSMDDFSYGERTIIEGSFPSDKSGCMISSDLANLNSLKIGDTIRFQIGPEKSEKDLTITGIFSDSTVERRQANHRASQLNTRNDIITTYDFFDEFTNPMESGSSFLLKNSDDLNAFQEELYSKGLSKSYVLEYDTNQYDQASAEISKMSTVVGTFFEIIILIGMSIIFLVNLFALRERKYEIGVLRAIGMPKRKVIFLLVGEMLILALFGIILAIIAGIFINPSVVDFMMRLEMNHELPSALKTAVSSINSSISLVVILELLASTTALVFLAGSTTISSIMRFDPTKILSERN